MRAVLAIIIEPTSTRAGAVMAGYDPGARTPAPAHRLEEQRRDEQEPDDHRRQTRPAARPDPGRALDGKGDVFVPSTPRRR